jgi:polyhydroxyalkanoate synthase subunit PhaC
MSSAGDTPPNWSRALERLTALQPVKRGSLPTTTLIHNPPFRLLHYPPPTDAPRPTRQPVLLVYSLVNRPDLLDMSPRRSVVRALIAAGFPVYLVDWGYPLDADRCLDLEDYVTDFLQRAVQATLRHAGVDENPGLTLVGVCQGGTLSLCLAALHPQGINRLALLGTPIDFHAVRHPLGQLAGLVPPCTDQAPDNIPGACLSLAFTSLKPVDLLVRRYRKLERFESADSSELEEFLQIEAWMYDCPDQPGRMFHRFIHDFYRDNRLVRDELLLDSRLVRLSALTMPVLNVFAVDDHLVPAPMSQALAAKLPAEVYHECPLPGGHLGIFLSERSRQLWLPALLRFSGSTGRDTSAGHGVACSHSG